VTYTQSSLFRFSIEQRIFVSFNIEGSSVRRNDIQHFDTQQSDTQHNDTMTIQSVIMLSVVYAKSCKQAYYAECRLCKVLQTSPLW
jgi:hypothetical protein